MKKTNKPRGWLHNHAKSILKSLLLSLHSAHQWSGLLSPLAVHPRVKLLRLLAECLLDPSRPDGAFMKLWARYN